MLLPQFDGIILAGGESRRMGTDKAFVTHRGRPLVDVALAALRDAQQVTVIGGDGGAFREHGVRWFPDDEPGQGPFHGVCAAMHHVEADLAVILPCDLVALEPSSVARLVNQLGDADCAVPLINGRHHWLPSVWRRSVAPQLQQVWATGERSVGGAIRQLRRVHVVDSKPHEWLDADTPDRLAP